MRWTALTGWYLCPCTGSSKEKESYVYELYGVCNHLGTPIGGHYTSYVKNANGKWYLFDDMSIKELEDQQDVITNEAYCLFYRKKK